MEGWQGQGAAAGQGVEAAPAQGGALAGSDGAPAEGGAPMGEDTVADAADKAKWTEVFWMLEGGGQNDRGAHYALTVAALKRKSSDIQKQIDALRLAENSLMQAADEEADAALAKAGPEPRRRDPKQARTWGQALAAAVDRQAREAGEAAAAEEPPYMATQLAQEAQQEVAEHFEAEAQKQAEANMKAVAQAEHTLRMQAEAVAQAQAVAEAQAKALADATAQAQAVAEIQRQMAAQVQEAQDAHEAQEAAVAERHALRVQGLNSKRLPLRPGSPPCTFFLRKGECKYGKNCKWDHPETALNSRGLPLRPGELPCAFYLRSGTCKFSNTCKFDHPEPNTETGTIDVQAHLEALTKAMVPQVAEFSTTDPALLDVQTRLVQLAAEAKLAELSADADAAVARIGGMEGRE